MAIPLYTILNILDMATPQSQPATSVVLIDHPTITPSALDAETVTRQIPIGASPFSRPQTVQSFGPPLILAQPIGWPLPPSQPTVQPFGWPLPQSRSTTTPLGSQPNVQPLTLPFEHLLTRTPQQKSEPTVDPIGRPLSPSHTTTTPTKTPQQKPDLETSIIVSTTWLRQLEERVLALEQKQNIQPKQNLPTQELVDEFMAQIQKLQQQVEQLEKANEELKNTNTKLATEKMD